MSWTKNKWFQWTLFTALVLIVNALAKIALTQWRGRDIVETSGLPELPSGAWIVYAHTDRHEFLFEEVALGFTAPSAQMDQWLRKVEIWKSNPTSRSGSILGYSIRRSNVRPGVNFSATISHK